MNRVVVTAGPTISSAEVKAIIAHAEVVAPIQFGDAFGYGLRRGDTLVVLDGSSLDAPPARQKELLALITDGVRVIGAGSVGALRAVECGEFGMEGYGWVYDAYRNDVLIADDEVWSVYGDADVGYPVIVDALVNIRHTMVRAVGENCVSEELAERLVSAAAGIPFTMRTWERILQEAGIDDTDAAALAKRLRRLRVDVMKDDAKVALRHAAAPAPIRVQVPAVAPTVWVAAWQQHWMPRTAVPIDIAGKVDTIDVTDLGVLGFLAMAGTDRWLYQPALEQLAAWHRDLTHPGGGGSVRQRALRAAATVGGACDYRHALEQIVHEHVIARGVVGESGFSDEIRARLLTETEQAELADRTDPAAVAAASARIATRTLFAAPGVMACGHLLDLVRQDSRLPQWRWAAARVLAARDEHAGRPAATGAEAAVALCARHWGVPAGFAERAARGLLTDEILTLLSRLFGDALSRGAMPRITVGELG